MSREAEPEQTLGLFRRASAGVGRSLPLPHWKCGQNDDKPRSAEFAPSKPPSGLTEWHENRSLNGAAKPRPTRNFRAADFISSLAALEVRLFLTGKNGIKRGGGRRSASRPSI